MTTPLSPEFRTINPNKYVPPRDPRVRKVWDDLVAVGCPVLGAELGWSDYAHFFISGECNFDSTHGEKFWAGYWEGCLDPTMMKILEKHGFYPEWINAGVLGIYDS